MGRNKAPQGRGRGAGGPSAHAAGARHAAAYQAGSRRADRRVMRRPRAADRARGARGDLGGTHGENADGDGQKALDLIADRLFRAAAGAASRWYASEEQETALSSTPPATSRWPSTPSTARRTSRSTSRSGRSSRILPALPRGGAGELLRRRTAQLGAGFVIYGPQLRWSDPRRGRAQSSPSTAPATPLLSTSASACRRIARVRDQRLELPALGRGRSAPTSTIASPAPTARASATSTCAGSPRWWPRRTAS